MGMMGGGMGMRMGGMGMMGGGMGMQGMQGMQGSQPEPEPEPPPLDIREYQVQHALAFVAQPEVRAEGLDHIKTYLTDQMGLSPDELVAVLQRSDLDPKALKSNVFLPSEEHEDLRLLPTFEEAADDHLYSQRRSDRERRLGVRSPGIGGKLAALAGMPATAAYSAVATMLGSAFMDAAGAGNQGQPLTPAQAQWAQQQAYYATHMLSQQAVAAEKAGLRVPPMVLVNNSGVPLGAPGAGVRNPAVSWTQRRITVTLFCIALAYWGMRSQWMASLRPKLVSWLQRLGTLCGLEILGKQPPELPPKPRRELTYGSAITVQNLSEAEGEEGRLGRKYNGRTATVRGFDRNTNKYKVILDSKKVEKLNEELLSLKPRDLRKRLEEVADNKLSRTGAPIEDEIPVRQTIAAAKRMEALVKEERVEEKKREREAEKAEKAGETPAPKPILSWKDRQEKEARQNAAEELQHKMVSMILLNMSGGADSNADIGSNATGADVSARGAGSGGVRCKALELDKEQMYDVETDQDLRTEMRSLRTQLQTMRTAIWQSKSAINTALQERKREKVRCFRSHRDCRFTVS
jgi:hypothetical protein